MSAPGLHRATRDEDVRPSLRTPSGFLAGASRRLAKTLPYRPHHLRLDAPVVSFSFDDFPASAAENAAPRLEDAGMRATFYLSSGLLGAPLDGRLTAGPETVAALHARGHEIGAHTHDHVSVQRLGVGALVADVTHNLAAIAALTGAPEPGPRSPLSFAYPYGVAGLRAKRALSGRFAGLRGIEPGINAGWIDLAHLKGQELYDRTSDLGSIEALLDEAERRRGWLVLYTHDVSASPSPIGCHTDYFARVVRLVAERGIAVRPVASVLAALDV